MAGQELAGRVTTAKKYDWAKGSIDLAAPVKNGPKTIGKNGADRYRVVAYDYGIKQNILRLLVDHGCDVTVVPAKTSAEDVLALKPNGVFLSNGPGDPEPITYAIEISASFSAASRSSASASAISSAASRSAARHSS